MKIINQAVLTLIVLVIQTGLMQPIQAAATTSSSIDMDRQGTGTINSIDLQRGLIVISDAEFRMSDKIVIHGRNSNTKLNLIKGMHVKYSYTPAKDRYVIDEIWINQ